jgi:hypothetical protein
MVVAVRERTAAKKLAAEYFERFPKDRYQTLGRELAPPAIARRRKASKPNSTKRAGVTGIGHSTRNRSLQDGEVMHVRVA